MGIVKVTSRVQIKKNIIPEVLRNIGDLDKFVTRVGFPAGGKIGAAIRSGSSSDTGNTRRTLSEVATIAFKLEFGPIGRKKKNWPFMTLAFGENLRKLRKLSASLVDRIIDNRVDAFRALSILGEFHQENIKDKIRTLRKPTLEQVTIDIKKSSNPLIDTGQMIQSVGHIEGKR